MATLSRRWPQYGLRELLIGVTILAGLCWFAVSLPWPISSSRVYGVKTGMTEAQVIEVMGSPHQRGNPDRDGGYSWSWDREGGLNIAVVTFSAAGQVTAAFDD